MMCRSTWSLIPVVVLALSALHGGARAENSGNPAIAERLTEHDQAVRTELERLEQEASEAHRSIGDQLEVIETDGERCTGAWSQTLNAAQRFVLVLGGAAVLDNETCLVWQRSPEGLETWEHAATECYAAETGGRLGWRLPTVEQLTSLIDPAQSDPALPVGHPFLNVSIEPFGFYWTATTVAGSGDLAWFAQFATGFPGQTFKAAHNLVWCVRGQQGYDAP